MLQHRRDAMVVMLAAAVMAAASAARGDGLALQATIERTTGDYGGPADVSDTYVPLMLRYETGRLAFRLIVPYLEAEFLEPQIEPGAEPSRYTEGGLGDVIAGMTVYDIFRSSDGSVVMDFTGKIKVPTADSDRGLGTGETDYSVQADFYKFLSRGLLTATLGYRFRGEPSGLTLDDSWLASIGGIYRFSAATSAGLFLDHRDSSIPRAESISEITLSLSHRVDEHWRVQGYLVRGLTETSLDWGAGLSVGRDF